MKTLNRAMKEAIKKANEIHGVVIDNRALCILFVKVESNYSDEKITKKEISVTDRTKDIRNNSSNSYSFYRHM